MSDRDLRDIGLAPGQIDREPLFSPRRRMDRSLDSYF
jgi:hypothetical protein